MTDEQCDNVIILYFWTQNTMFTLITYKHCICTYEMIFIRLLITSLYFGGDYVCYYLHQLWDNLTYLGQWSSEKRSSNWSCTQICVEKFWDCLESCIVFVCTLCHLWLTGMWIQELQAQIEVCQFVNWTIVQWFNCCLVRLWSRWCMCGSLIIFCRSVSDPQR